MDDPVDENDMTQESAATPIIPQTPEMDD